MRDISPNNVVLNNFYIILLLTIFAGCTSLQQSASELPIDSLVTEDIQVIMPVEVTWYIPEGPEQFLRPRTWDLKHQKIWVRFDFNREAVIGRTELFLTSISSLNKTLVLDSKTTTISAVTDIRTSQNLGFQQDSATVSISLPRAFSAGDTLIVGITYEALPPKRGLYFVNADGSEEGKPTQIWTLGQPEDNSFWLPTIDNPAERATQETWISVPDRFTSVANGVLIESKTLPGDSLRTDYWFMDKPHAPYLFALAVGEYEIFDELVDGVLLRYYVEPQFASNYEQIYANTADMLRYFTRSLGVEYPWYVYAQVPVRDYIAGGMENTTLSILFDGVQVDARKSMDVNQQGLIAHELIHQWFGNLVTCKDWANLPLNEGFASYFEILYSNHKDGPDKTDWLNNTNRNSYFAEAQSYRRPLIFNRYNEPEDMYDRHTYQKAGQILRMLHHISGDDHWWGAMNRYLTDHAYSYVDWTDLKKVFEQETGNNLNTFFRQWFTTPGHPEIEIKHHVIDSVHYVQLTQIQDTSRQEVFHIPIDIHYNSNEYNEMFVRTVQMVTQDTLIAIDFPYDKLGDVVVDPNRVILAQYTETLSYMDVVSRLAHPSAILRYEALLKAEYLISEHAELIDVLKDAYHIEQIDQLRLKILRILAPHAEISWKPFIEQITFETDLYYLNRIAAADMSYQLFGTENNSYLYSLQTDPSYFVERHIINLLTENKE
jgi:aminopeptidase N